MSVVFEHALEAVQVARDNAAVARTAIAQRDALQKKLDSVIAAYERAVKDPNTVIPSYMMAAIEVAKL